MQKSIKKISNIKWLNVKYLIPLALLLIVFKLGLETYINDDYIYKIVYLGDQRRTSYVTVVSTLFLFGKSKHSISKYDAWSNLMIKSMGAPIVAFIDFNWEKKFIERCQQRNITGIVYITQSIWDIMGELEKARKKDYLQAYKEKQWHLDGEKNIHSPELYAVWNIKTYLMNKVSRKNPYKSEFFIYTDSGAWRDRQFTKWPDEPFVRNVANKLDDRILYAQIADPNIKYFSPRTDFIQGGFFAGTPRAISKAYDNFYNLHDEWLAKGMFIGKDQHLMNELTFNRAKSSIARLRTRGLRCTSWYDPWFFYQYYFSQQSEYICNEDRLSLLIV